jgi:hypothetical protein
MYRCMVFIHGYRHTYVYIYILFNKSSLKFGKYVCLNIPDSIYFSMMIYLARQVNML